MGFGAVAYELFTDLDRDHSGSVNYKDLLEVISKAHNEEQLQEVRTKTFATKMFLLTQMAHAWNESDKTRRKALRGRGRELDVNTGMLEADFKAADADGLVAEMRQWVKQCKLSTADMDMSHRD